MPNKSSEFESWSLTTRVSESTQSKGIAPDLSPVMAHNRPTGLLREQRVHRCLHTHVETDCRGRNQLGEHNHFTFKSPIVKLVCITHILQ